MRLDQLVKNVKWADVVPVLDKRDNTDRDKYDNMSGFKDVHDKLCKMSMSKLNDIIHIKHVVDDSFEYEDVYATCPGEADPDQHFAIEFVPWSEWLGHKISKYTLDTYTVPEIVAYCIWEMTFYGFDESKIKGYIDGLLAKDDIDKSKYLSADEAFKNLKD